MKVVYIACLIVTIFIAYLSNGIAVNTVSKRLSMNSATWDFVFTRTPLPAITSRHWVGWWTERRGHVRMTNRRAWDLKFAFEHAASHVVSPDIMRRLLGHAMFFSTLNRSGMSVFRRCYDFIESNCEPRMLNKQESRECIIFSGLIPLLFADIKRGWSDVITCTDASPDGFGICEQRVGGASAQRLGRWNERWRFKRLGPEEWAPRRRGSSEGSGL